jgi:hypothetical protein
MNEQRAQDAQPPPAPPDAAADGSLLQAVPGLARIAVSAWWHTAEWAASASLRASSRVFRAAVNGESPAQLFAETGAELRAYVRSLLAIVDPDDRIRTTATDVAASARGRDEDRRDGADGSLRERGAELLRRSADVHFSEQEHPAYERILEQLAPDEGRILRLLAVEGPQASVDVRTGTLPVSIGSELVAPGLNMIGAEAGCRYEDRVPAYLNNLNRLGLIWFSREPVEDRHRYQVLEAQPDVLAALRKAGRGRTIRRSIHLTPFGHDFCETCLPLHTGELEALPGDTAHDSAQNGEGARRKPRGRAEAKEPEPGRGGRAESEAPEPDRRPDGA